MCILYTIVVYGPTRKEVGLQAYVRILSDYSILVSYPVAQPQTMYNTHFNNYS